MTERIVLIALMPSHPARSAARPGSSMWVMLGVIFAQTGFVATPFTQPQTSSRISGSCPIAEPIFRSGSPCGHEKLSSNASTPAASHRSTISIHASRLNSSMLEAIRTPSGYLSLTALNSSSQVSNGRSLMSSMFSQPKTSRVSSARMRA